VSWSTFESLDPDLAAESLRLLVRDGIGQGLLATVGGDGPVRIHPIWLAVVDGRLLTFILASAKRRDLETDGRYALHNHVDPAAPAELSIRGRARPVDDPAIREPAAAVWAFQVDAGYRLFELDVEAVVLGARAGADDWPPVYTSWKAPAPVAG